MDGIAEENNFHFIPGLTLCSFSSLKGSMRVNVIFSQIKQILTTTVN